MLTGATSRDPPMARHNTKSLTRREAQLPWQRRESTAGDQTQLAKSARCRITSKLTTSLLLRGRIVNFGLAAKQEEGSQR
jgi:hypothetical protein